MRKLPPLAGVVVLLLAAGNATATCFSMDDLARVGSDGLGPALFDNLKAIGEMHRAAPPVRAEHVAAAPSLVSELGVSLLTDVRPAGRNAARGLFAPDEIRMDLTQATPSAAIPEPVTFVLIGSGLIALGVARRWRKR